MNPKKKLVVLTGAGISAESGLQTFRGPGGLWNGRNVQEVASPEGWERSREMVLEFYNQRRREVLKAEPNEAHKTLAEMQKHFDITVITQNVDDLHERAGSKNIIHLHGEILKARSIEFPELIYEWNKDLNPGDLCEKGTQLRPCIVWFGEPVPEIENAIHITRQADLFLVIGTSLNVYPAAGLIDYVNRGVPIYAIDIEKPEGRSMKGITFVQGKAGEKMKKLAEIMMND